MSNNERKYEFAKGIVVNKHTFPDGGFCIDVGINKKQFLENLFNDKGWANFDIRFRKSDGEPYCVVNDYHATVARTTNKEKPEPEQTNAEVEAVDEEIPF